MANANQVNRQQEPVKITVSYAFLMFKLILSASIMIKYPVL
jgi:hypothetical protein